MYNDVLYKGLTLTIKKKTNTSPMEQHKISQYMDGQATNTSIKKKKKRRRRRTSQTNTDYKKKRNMMPKWYAYRVAVEIIYRIEICV